ncbi:MAG: DUF3108 domain-containing protein, partial [candidate division WOR-3 bacterium]
VSVGDGRFAFAPAETLRYEVRYGPLKLGTLELVTLSLDTVRAEPCYHFRGVLKSNPTLSLVFEAEYVLETWCRVRDMVTLRSYKRTREQRYRTEWVADFDYEQRVVRYNDNTEYPLGGLARDLVTLWYFFRTLTVEPGSSMKVYVHTDRRDYDTEFRALGHTRVRVPAGEFSCLEMKPTTSCPLGAAFLADNPDKVPVVIRTRLGSAVVSAFLSEVARGR